MSTDNILKIIAFSAGVVFSGTVLAFSLYQSARDPSSQWIALASSIVGLFLPSPLQMISPQKITLTQTGAVTPATPSIV